MEALVFDFSTRVVFFLVFLAMGLAATAAIICYVKDIWGLKRFLHRQISRRITPLDDFPDLVIETE
jgi:hypothetical protein